MPDRRDHLYYPRDTTVPPAAQDQFRTNPSGDVHRGYATIAFLPNLDGSGKVLILSATGGTAAAVDFLSDEGSMQRLRARLPTSSSSSYPHFEALIQTEKGFKDAASFKVVVAHPPVAHT